MRIVRASEMTWRGNQLRHRKGKILIKRLIEGGAGSPENYGLHIGCESAEFFHPGTATPGTRFGTAFPAVYPSVPENLSTPGRSTTSRKACITDRRKVPNARSWFFSSAVPAVRDI